MSGGGGKKNDPPVPAGPGSDPDDELLTSEDLFGSLVDAPLPPGESSRASRKDPIRVQVSDPVTPGPFAVVSEDPPGPSAAAPEEAPSPFDAVPTAVPQVSEPTTPPLHSRSEQPLATWSLRRSKQQELR